MSRTITDCKVVNIRARSDPLNPAITGPAAIFPPTLTHRHRQDAPLSSIIPLTSQIMDIDDILLSVSAPLGPRQGTQDLQTLTRAWVSERAAPELLPYPTALMARTTERIRLQARSFRSLALPLPTTSFMRS